MSSESESSEDPAFFATAGFTAVVLEGSSSELSESESEDGEAALA